MMNGRIVFAALLMAFIATPLCAQFVRLEVDQVKAHTEGELAGFNTYRVYAVLAEEGNVIDAVYGEKNAPLTISTTTSFYQHPRGGALSVDVQRYDMTVAPELVYDSWVTIGLEDNYMNTLSGFVMDFNEFETNGGSIQSNNGAWFVTPDKKQAEVGSSKRMLLMKLTSDGHISGVLNIHGRTLPITEENAGKEVIEIRAEGLQFFAGK